MPIYEYRCTSCGRMVEVIHSISGTGPEACDVCGGVMKKALTTPAIHFKGSGWAKKDARAASGSAGATAGARDDGGGEGKAAGSDGAPAAATPSDAPAAKTPPGSASKGDRGAAPSSSPAASSSAKARSGRGTESSS